MVLQLKGRASGGHLAASRGLAGQCCGLIVARPRIVVQGEWWGEGRGLAWPAEPKGGRECGGGLEGFKRSYLSLSLSLNPKWV